MKEVADEAKKCDFIFAATDTCSMELHHRRL